MEFLDDLLALHAQTSPFCIPTASQCQRWIKHTQGLVDSSYTGLTVSQQQFLQDDMWSTDRVITHHHVPPVLAGRRKLIVATTAKSIWFLDQPITRFQKRRAGFLMRRKAKKQRYRRNRRTRAKIVPCYRFPYTNNNASR